MVLHNAVEFSVHRLSVACGFPVLPLPGLLREQLSGSKLPDINVLVAAVLLVVGLPYSSTFIGASRLPSVKSLIPDATVAPSRRAHVPGMVMRSMALILLSVSENQATKVPGSPAAAAACAQNESADAAV